MDGEEPSIQINAPVQGLNIAHQQWIEQHIYQPESAATPTTPLVPLWNVPLLRNPHFTGRDELLDRIEEHLALLAPDEQRKPQRVALTQPQAITGLGGIGKTQLAVEYAYRSRERGRYTHTLWINAASEETIIASFVELAADALPASVVQSETDQHKLAAAVRHWLERCEQPWLLIFDNADDPSMIGPYLPRNGNGSVLLTTRAHAVGSLATSIEVETMGFLEGTQLLLRRSQRFEHASDEEINQAGNIVVALDHFPLALDQAGAYLEETQCSFKDYLDLYRAHRQELLAQRGKEATNYPDSVAATWLLSFRKVEQTNPAAAKLLELCSFLAPDRIPVELLRDGAAYWPASLQQAVADPLLFQRLIADLLKFSLVKRLVEEHALSIHRLVQAVQRDRMELEMQRQWAERAVRAVNTGLPNDPKDMGTWPQYLRYLDQVQVCYTLTEQYILPLVEAANLLNRTGLYLIHQALHTPAEPLLKRALAIREQQLGANHLDTASSLNNLALLYGHQGRYKEAEPLYLRALSIREQQLGANHPDTASNRSNLAGLYRAQGRYKEAEPLYLRTLSIHEQQLGANHPDTASCLHNLAAIYHDQGRYADFYYDQGRYKEAELLYLRALSIREQQLGANHPDTASSLSSLAGLYRAQGRCEEAEPLHLRALSICEQQLGANHPDTASCLHNLALLYEHQGRYEEAEPLYLRALSIREQQLGANHPDTASCLHNLALLYSMVNWNEKAELLYLRALSIREQQLGANHPLTVSTLNNLTDVYYCQGRYEEAEPLHLRALSIREQQLGANHPLTASSLNNLALFYEHQGRYKEAEPLYLRALSICEQQLGQEHPMTQSIRDSYSFIIQSIERNASRNLLKTLWTYVIRFLGIKMV